MKIERVTSPGGIEAWLVESHANPLIAMRFAFRGGATQDPKGKEGLAYFVSGDDGRGRRRSRRRGLPGDGCKALAMRMDFDAEPRRDARQRADADRQQGRRCSTWCGWR